MQDFALQMRWLVDQAYPDVPVVRVVLDNLNTHRTASLYEAFPPAEARRHRPATGVPLHAQARELLNMAEMEFSVLARACLRGRNPDQDSLERAVNANVSERNAVASPINWRFTTRKGQNQTPQAIS